MGAAEGRPRPEAVNRGVKVMPGCGVLRTEGSTTHRDHAGLQRLRSPARHHAGNGLEGGVRMAGAAAS